MPWETQPKKQGLPCYSVASPFLKTSPMEPQSEGPPQFAPGKGLSADGLDLGILLDLPALQALMDDFHRLTQAVVAILDLKGRVLLAVGWQDVCTQFHRMHPETARNCLESDLFLAGNVKPGEYVAYQCRNGLWDVVTPLAVAGIHVGNIYTGQFFYDDQEVDLQVFGNQAEVHGFDREAYLAAVDRVPRLSRERVKATMDFLVHFTGLVSEQGLNAWRSQRAVAEQAQALESLQRSEESYKALFDSVLYGIVYHGSDGKIQSANPAAERILGLSLEQLQGRTSIDPRWQTIHEDGSPFPGETHPAMVALGSGRPVQGVVMGVFNPETSRTAWIEVSAMPFFHPGEDRPFRVCASFQDITARKGLDDARAFLATAGWVRTGEDFFQALARFLARHLEMDFVCIDRLAGDALSAETLAICYDGRLDPNVSYTLKETPCGEVVGKAVCSFPSGVRHRFPQDAVLQDMGAESYVGVTLWGSAGQPIGLIAVIGRHPLADTQLAESVLALVAQRAAAELELREVEADCRLSEARLDQAFEASPIGMALVGLDGRFLRINPVFCAIVGWSEAELLERSFQAITHPEDLGPDLEFVQEMIKGRRQSYQMDKRYLRKDGGEVWAQLNVILVRDPEDTPLHFLSQIQDIGGQIAADHQRTITLEVLDALNRVEDPRDAAGRILQVIKREVGVEAAAIRLAQGDDFTYAAADGFAEDFLQAESCLLARDGNGEPRVDAGGRPLLECTCGLVLSGCTDPASPFFTPGGSVSINDTAPLLELPAAQDPRFHPRNRCIQQGYKSVALVPIRSGKRILGLLQLNDPRPNRFAPDLIAFLEGLTTSIGHALTRKVLRDDLGKSLDHLRLTHEAALAGSWEWEPRTGRSVWSDEALRLYGFAPGSPPSYDAWLKAIHPEDRDRALRDLEAAVERGSALDLEWRVVPPDGSIRWLLSRGHPEREAGGKVLRYLGIVLDITGRKQAELALAESEGRFRLAMEATSDGLWDWDIGTGDTYFSPGHGRMLGYGPGEFSQRAESWEKQIHPEDHERVLAVNQACIDGIRPAFEVEYRLRHRDGSWKWILGRGRAVARDGGGRALRMVGTQVDITAQVQAREDLRYSKDLYAVLSEANRAIVGCAGRDALFRETVRICAELGHFELTWIGEPDPARERILVAAAHGPSLDYLDGIQISALADHPSGQGPTGTCFREVRTVIAQDWAADPSVGFWKGKGLAAGIRSSAALPVLQEGRVAVVLTLYSKEPGFFLPDRLHLLGQLAEGLGHALERFASEDLRRRATAALQESEEKFARSFRGASMLMTLSDLETDSYEDVNDAFLQASGFAREEVVGRTSLELGWITPEDRAELRRRMLEDGGIHGHTLVTHAKDGRTLTCLFSGELVTIGGRSRMLATAQDITDRKKAEAELKASEARHRLLADNATDVIWTMDLQGRFTYVSPSVEKLRGYTAEEVLAQSIDEALTPESAQVAHKELSTALEQLAATGNLQTFRGELEQPCKNGSTIWTEVTTSGLRDDSGQVVGIIGVTRDVTERRRDRELIEKRIVALTQPMEGAPISFEELFNLDEIQHIQDVFAAATGVASIITRPDGTPITGPSNFTHLCSGIIRKTEVGCANCFKSDAVLGRQHPGGPIVQQCLSGGLWDAGASVTVGGQHIANWLIGQVRDDTQTDEQMLAYAREIGADEASFLAAFHAVPAMPRERFEQIAKALFTLSSQLSTTAYQNVQQARFIVERKQAEETQRALEQQLHHAQKMESLGSLAGGVAHDLNNVLGAIMSLSSMLRRRFLPPDPAAGSLDIISKACARGRDVVKNLLLFARRDLEVEGMVDLNVMVGEMVSLLSHTTLKRARLDTDLQEPLPAIKGDSGALSHVLINLCVNAVDAMPDGGTIHISTRHAPGGGITLGVRDNGTGMGPEVLARAMEPFFTTKPAGKGTGLGLAMVYGTMKAHDGEVTIHSEPGQGTEILLSFPASRVEGAGRAVPGPTSEPAPARKRRILLVDDDDLIRESVVPMLQVLGHDTWVASGGLEALDLFQGGLEVDLVILDMNMPEMSGVDAYARIRALRPGQAIVVATGYEDVRLQALRSRYPDLPVINKPFSLEEIGKVIEEVQT
jgi:PAS domain S-box-containing protein